MMDVLGFHLGIGKGLPDRLDRGFDQVADQLLELCPCEVNIKEFWAARTCRDVGEVDGGLHLLGELDLRILRGIPQPLHGDRVGPEVDPFLLPELLNQVVRDPLVKVIPSKEVIPGGCLDLEYTITEGQD